MNRVVVIGGGITGLAAAWELTRTGADTVLLEASDRLGGALRTSDVAGIPVDEGADAFLARVPWATELCRELGVDDRLVAPAEGAAYVYADGALRRLPEGHVLGVPTNLDALRESKLVSEAGIDRAARDLDGATPPAPAGDESIGALIRRRLGDEVLERLVGPLVGGINAGDPDRLSAAAVAPQLAEAAAHPSMITALRATLRSTPTGQPVFLTLPEGLGTLPALLAERLGPAVHLDSPVAALEHQGTTWIVHTGDEAIEADAVVVATPAPIASGLLSPLSAEAAELLAGIEYVSVAIVTLAIPASAAPPLPTGSGFLVPREARLALTACSWATSKWAHLSRPGGPVLLRASAGRHGDERAFDLDDDDLVAALLADLHRTMDLRAEPVAVRVSRWPRSFPQYAPGHLERVDAVERALRRDTPALVVAGAAGRGLGVPACVRQGRQAGAALGGHRPVVYNS